MAKSQSSEPPEYLTVTQFIRHTVRVLEGALPVVYLQGEVGEIHRAPSGHVYLTLKDEASQLYIVIWSSVARQLERQPEQGMRVLCRGKPSIYPNRGRFQVAVDWLIPSGEGELQRRYLELKAKLEAEGLFAEERKRALPFLPRCIGVVTSAGGAVIHDIMVRVRERMPHLQVELFDARVQGNGAAEEIASGIRWFNEKKTVDVIIVARGGGSLEDLWAFNEEVVVRAIFASKIPVVSGVGHEVDVTLADLVADVRAPTPTAAAEIVVPHRRELHQRLRELSRRLRDTDRWFLPFTERLDDVTLQLTGGVERKRQSILLLLSQSVTRLERLRPERVIAELRSRLTRAHLLVVEGTRRRILDGGRQTSLLTMRLRSSSPEVELRRFRERLREQHQRLQSVVTMEGRTLRERALSFAARLHAASPVEVLRRGFAIVERSGRIIPSAAALSSGDRVEIRFHDGKVTTTVEKGENQDGTQREAHHG